MQPTKKLAARPRINLDMKLLEIIKGDANGMPDDSVQRIYTYYPPDAPARSRLPGVWSYLELAPGQYHYLFCKLSGSNHSLSEITSELNCKQVIDASPKFLKNIEVIKQMEMKPSSELDVLTQVDKNISDLDGFFFAYLLANPKFQILKDHKVFDRLMVVLENPILKLNVRAFLESELCSHFVMPPFKDAWFANRFAIVLFRLLSLEQADIPNTLGTYLPNHLGLEGGGGKLTAADVFKQYPSDRVQAMKILQKQASQDKNALALLNWLNRPGIVGE